MLKRIGFVATFTMVSILSNPAVAADQCESRVFDTTGKLTGISSVDAAANTLTSAGAEVRIRVISIDEVKSAGNIDRYVAAMAKRCLSWQSPNGGLKNNLIVVVVTPPIQEDGKPVTYSGVLSPERGTYASLIPQTAAIRKQMSPVLKIGDIGGALRIGITAIHGVIAQSAAPAAPVRTETRQQAPIAPAAPQQVTVINEKPTDWSGFIAFMKFLFGLGALGGLGYLGYLFWSKKEKARGAKQAARMRHNACTNLVNELNDLLEKSGRILDSFVSAMDASEFNKLRLTLDGMKARYSTASRAYVGTDDQSLDPERNGLSEVEYERIERVYESQLASLQDLETEIRQFDRTLSSLNELIANSQSCIDSAEALIQSAKASIATQKQAGFKVEALETATGEADELIEVAKAAKRDKKFQELSGLCEDAGKLARQASREASQLAQKRKDAEQSIERLATQITSAESSPRSAKSLVESIRTEYGNDEAKTSAGQEAIMNTKLAAARSALASARLSLTVSDLVKVETHVSTGRQALEYVSSALRDIETHKASLDQAKLNREREAERARYAAAHPVSRSTSSGYGQRTVVRERVIVERDDDQFGNAFTGALAGSVLGNALSDRSDRDDYHRRDRDESSGSIFGGSSGRDADDDNDSVFGGGSGRDSDPPSSPSNDTDFGGSSGRDDD